MRATIRSHFDAWVALLRKVIETPSAPLGKLDLPPIGRSSAIPVEAIPPKPVPHKPAEPKALHPDVARSIGDVFAERVVEEPRCAGSGLRRSDHQLR